MGRTNENIVQAEILINNLKKGVESAYEALFKTFYRELVNYANKYLYDIEASKEVVQDLFVDIFEKRNRLEINTSLRAYLFRAVQNKCINYIKSQKIRERYAKQENKEHYREYAPVEKSMDLAELENALYNAIGELPPKCRMIFKLNRFEGCSNQEIADRLDLSKRTVETQITKALRALREKLKPFIHETIVILVLVFNVC